MRTAPRFFQNVPSIAGLVIVLAASFFAFASCASTKPADTGAESAAEIERLKADIQTLQAQIDELKAGDQALIDAKTDADARAAALNQENHELKTNIARLETLLNDLQALQLSLMMGPVDGQNVSIRDANPSPTPTPAEQPSPSPQPGLVASPPPTPSPVPIPSPAPMPSPSPAASPSPTVSPAVSPSPSPSPVPSLVPSPSPSIAPSPKPSPAASPGAVLLNGPASGRTDRTEQRPTKLFAENDRARGSTYYYHRDAWYDRPGMFVEIVRQGKIAPSAVLRILRTASELPSLYTSAAAGGNAGIPATISFGNANTAIAGTVNGSAFGIDRVVSFAATLDQNAMISLLRELTKLDPAYTIQAVDAQGAPQPVTDTTARFAVDDKTRRSLFEMVSAYRDMVNAP